MRLIQQIDGLRRDPVGFFVSDRRAHTWGRLRYRLDIKQILGMDVLLCLATTIVGIPRFAV